ncbi:8-amino-7-oxononanoate synthase [Thiohalophilus thiocyanatoxydans]|uniref:8-amino-7-oxononanoate synthase n=1 Tax=Thiohalophilus thiocyanatoxydans TaxID=381308 RepID=A0A4R8ISQ0_9GAMM|nr:8-amino-7-oxononanoate synthase [Thiohalophilus thiocyanatoxydans]TDY04081.1 8-amino-7-oxononanoate synthase [Thiohalophilus thiocyanatoxydans]
MIDTVKLQQSLEARRARHLYRSRQVLEGPQGPRVVIDGREYLNFCSNDYLGLANHPEVVQAFKRGVDEFGVGSGAAHLVTGHARSHHQLEEELAGFVGRPRALLFSTGYMANLGVASALLGRKDAIFEDRINHASLLDAAQLSGARLQRYRHAGIEHLQQLVENNPSPDKLIATDGVFSMDGDLAPLPALAQVARQHGAWLMVDDAHGLGVIGATGRGSLEQFGLGMAEVPILVGTLGKGFGTFGAFVAGEAALIETLIQEARSYIYTTALPPAVAEATRTSLQLVQRESWRREKLQALIAQFRSGAAQLGLQLGESSTPIQPWIVGDTEQAVQLSEKLKQQGILISAIRPPTVPQGTARLRITFSAAHEAADVDHLLGVIAGVR